MPMLIPNNEPRRIPLAFAAADGSAAAPPATLTFASAAGMVTLAYADGALTVTPLGGVGTDTITAAGLAGSLVLTLTAPAARVSFGEAAAA
ncbi:hypothetical protein [Phaeospirillum tilakii]|uniref:Uncharacterized protein n=1 Tax=Phaeospirillum tilakii TaxID=741673 RepID=A0ABW5CCT2_9PROT